MPFPEPRPAGPQAPAPASPRGIVAFSAGSVISRGFGVWFRNFVPFSVVTLLVYLPVFVLALATPADAGPGWNFIDRVASGLANLVVTGALAYGVLQSLHGGRAGIGVLVRTGFRKMGSVFLVSFAVGLWVLLGMILLVVPAIVWYCGLYVAVPAVVVEADLGASDALSRSRTLTEGHRWTIFAVVLVVFVVTVAGASVAGTILLLAAAALPQPVGVFVATAVLALSGTFGACASAVAYHDLRVAKEGVSTAELVKVFD